LKYLYLKIPKIRFLITAHIIEEVKGVSMFGESYCEYLDGIQLGRTHEKNKKSTDVT